MATSVLKLRRMRWYAL